MLVVSRKPGEDVVINVTEPCQIVVKTVRIGPANVRIGFTAPKASAEILRGELILEETR